MKKIKKITLYLSITLLSFILVYYLPFSVGWYGESPAYRFKFAIYHGECGIEGESYKNACTSFDKVPDTGLADYLGLTDLSRKGIRD